MSETLFTLVYCSRNTVVGDAHEKRSELTQILARARANNAKVGVTGALLYNAGTFAQVLEGPLAAVERIFEKIQRDHRHAEVLILRTAPAATRLFPEWSMAFAGEESGAGIPKITEALNAAFANPQAGGEQVMELLRGLIAQEDGLFI